MGMRYTRKACNVLISIFTPLATAGAGEFTFTDTHSRSCNRMVAELLTIVPVIHGTETGVLLLPLRRREDLLHRGRHLELRVHHGGAADKGAALPWEERDGADQPHLQDPGHTHGGDLARWVGGSSGCSVVGE